METVECPQCKSVMGLVRTTPRWAVYKCFSCRIVTGQLSDKLEPSEIQDAEGEMNSYVGSLMVPDLKDIAIRLQSTSPKEHDRFLERQQGNKMLDDMVTNTQTQPKGRGASHDWLSALQSYEFVTCFVVSRDGGRTCVECACPPWTYRAFFDAHGEEFIFQWIVSHQSIGQLNKQGQG